MKSIIFILICICTANIYALNNEFVYDEQCEFCTDCPSLPIKWYIKEASVSTSCMFGYCVHMMNMSLNRKEYIFNKAPSRWLPEYLSEGVCSGFLIPSKVNNFTDKLVTVELSMNIFDISCLFSLK